MVSKVRKNINLLLVIGWMCFIFYMSNKPAEVSNGQSDFVLNLLNSIGLNLNSVFGNFSITIIRKGAHITEYLILFLLLYNYLKDCFINKKLYIICFIIVVIYACTDEFHQLFIPGRAGKITDVIIDSTGAMIGILIMYLKSKIGIDKKRDYS